MRGLGGTTPEGRADPPAMLASAGVPHDDLRGQSFPALMDAMTVGCRSLGWRPRAFPAIPFPPRWRPDACPVMAFAGVPGDDLSRHGMRCP
jgi:hypothetical protein